MTERKQRAEGREVMLDWQFPDEEAWITEPTNIPAPARRRGLPEQTVVLLLILVCVAYWLWSAAENEKERSKIALQQRMTQISPTNRAEHDSRTKVSDEQKRKQTTLVPSAVTLLTVIAEGQAHQATPTSQQSPARHHDRRTDGATGSGFPSTLSNRYHTGVHRADYAVWGGGCGAVVD